MVKDICEYNSFRGDEGGGKLLEEGRGFWLFARALRLGGAEEGGSVAKVLYLLREEAILPSLASRIDDLMREAANKGYCEISGWSGPK